MAASPHKQQAIHKYPTRRPAELEAPPVDHTEYHAYRTATDLREPYRVPLTYLRETKKFVVPELPEAPLIVFINSRSGGRSGPKLAETLFHALGHSQVYDLNEYRPGPVLQRIYANLTASAQQGDSQADIIRSRLRILAAGGDGTVAWILTTIMELQLQPPPAVAVMPLGTGNDLSLSFGWGNTFLHKWISDYKTLYATMKRIADAEPRELDTWNITMSAGSRSLFKQLPHSLALVDNLQKSSASPAKVEGLFFNYFSVGLDAQAAYGFHHLRETKPWAAPSRLINQAWYAYFSCSSGWFCGAPSLNTTATLKVKGLDGTWQPVRIPKSVKALVLLNLQSYGGGRDIWGLADSNKDTKRGWKTPIFNDGMFEGLSCKLANDPAIIVMEDLYHKVLMAVGLQSGYHTAVVMGGLYYKVHGLRLAQANEMQLELKSHGRGSAQGGGAGTHMQLDGEPWMQELPHGEDATPMKLHVSHSGTSRMLFNTEKLSGLPRKIKALARREAEVSMVQQMSTTPGGLPEATYFQGASLTGASSQPRTPITVALPPTRQSDKPGKSLRTPKLGNPAVPVAGAADAAGPTAATRQHGAAENGMTDQGLAFGRSSDPQRSGLARPQTVAGQDGAVQGLTVQSSATQSNLAEDSATQASAGQDSAQSGTAQALTPQVLPAQALTPQHQMSTQQPQLPNTAHGVSQQQILSRQRTDGASSSATAAGSGVSRSYASPTADQSRSLHIAPQRPFQTSPALADMTAPGYGSSSSTEGVLPSLETPRPYVESGMQQGQPGSIPTAAASEHRSDSPVRARIQALEQRQSQQGLLLSQPETSAGPDSSAASPVYTQYGSNGGSSGLNELSSHAGPTFAGQQQSSSRDRQLHTMPSELQHRMDAAASAGTRRVTHEPPSAAWQSKAVV